MEQDSTPGALGSNAGLGPLPEPYLSAAVTASLLGPNVTEPLFTADQMRAYAASPNTNVMSEKPSMATILLALVGVVVTVRELARLIGWL